MPAPTDLSDFSHERFVAARSRRPASTTSASRAGRRAWIGTSTRCRATAQLNEIGVGVAGDGVVTDLTNRLRIEQWRKDHPDVAPQQIVRPIIIVGQPRTGTSILHDLMAQDPANRAPLSWEVERPVPAPRTETYGTDPRIAECQAGFDLVESIIPGFTAFHELGARSPRRTCASSPATSGR